MASSPDTSPVKSSSNRTFKIVGIGASAGGLEAFTEFVRNLPREADVGYVLVQHLDPTHRSLLSELLGRSSVLPVQEIAPDTRVQPNHIYVIPPNSDLDIVDGVLKLSPRDKTGGGPARSIDHFLKSLAADQGNCAIGVILTGAGSDGAEGIKAIKEAGGLTFAQDEVSSKYDSMPRSAAATGCVDFVLPPEKIAVEIARVLAAPRHTRRRAAANARNRRGRVTRKPAIPNADNLPEASDWPKAPKDADLRRILVLLRTHTGIDFSLYRGNTIRRRLGRRLSLSKLKNLAAYARLLRESPSELDALHQDLLINVSNFFRNPGVFETLKKRVFPKLVKNAANNETLRFWIAGCSTGQEAYTYAMAFIEFLENTGIKASLQIFATDVNARVLELARAGVYAKAQLAGLSAARVKRFFTRDHDSYQVVKSLRDQVIFAQHNLLTDPPFTRVDLISCRNVLIYIEAALQQKILPTFHYALKPGGVLVLGASESIGGFNNLFSTTEKSQKIYTKKPVLHAIRPERAQLPVAARPLCVPAAREPEPAAPDAFREADRLVVSRYAPPSVLVSGDGDILQFRGKVETFLDLPNGRASLNVYKMARGSLGLSLQKALKRARTENRPVREKVPAYEDPRHSLELAVLPIRRPDSTSFLVVFERLALPPPVEAKGRSTTPATRSQATRLAGMKRELGESRDHLQNLREQYETVVEELQASNEEVQSSNEELQSLNEELETSNEELESANEELTTLNEELATRNTELRESEQRLREQAQLVELAPLLARSSKDRIIFWNRGAENLYGFTRDEAMGQNSHLLLRALYPEPREKIQATVESRGRWEGELVYHRKDGTALTIATQWVLHIDEATRTRAILEVGTDVTARRRAEQSLRESQELNHRILQSSPDCILVLDLAGRVVTLNEAAIRCAETGLLPVAIGRHWSSLWTPDSRAGGEAAYRIALAGETERFVGGSEGGRWWDVVVRPILDGSGHPERLLAVCRDVTERRLVELAAVEEARLVALRADVTIQIARGGELVPILQQIAQMLVHHTESVYARIWLMDADGKVLHLRASEGLFAHIDDHRNAVAVGEGPIGMIASKRRPYTTHEVSLDATLCNPDWARREGITSFAGYPLVYESRVLGVFAILARRQFAPRALRELSLTVDAMALLIQRKQADDERARLLHHATEAKNAAIAASRAKDEFLGTLSHELRTPLSPVLLLASNHAGDPGLSEEIRATFETIRHNVQLEARLIDDLLDVTRIVHGKLTLKLKPVDLNQLVTDAVHTISATAEHDSARFAVTLAPEQPMVSGDAVRLQQVLWNLLSNAVKFTPHGGLITIQTRVRDSRAVVEVTDTGIGMRDSDLKRIFEPFLQVERRRGGLGLGLAISRQLLEQHDGTIRASSSGPGKGSTFVIELPVLSIPAEEKTAPAQPHNGNGHSAGQARHASNRASRRPDLRLLLVEDHASTRSTLRVLLSQRNFEVVAVDSATEARRQIRRGRFDVLVSDLGLPDGHGHDLLHEFRLLQPDLIGIALSGYGTDEDVALSHAAGYATHLTKPVQIEDLDDAITRVLPLADPGQEPA